MTALILQGRLDSKRLPGKSLLSLEGEPLIYRVMEALGTVPCDPHILACPEDCEETFRPLARRAGFEIFAGPKDDVLGRYCGALRRCGSRRLIRATADNPFVFADAAALLAEESAALGADYAAYAGLPLGAGVEVLSAEALFRAEREAREPGEREHVCPYLYGHPELFYLHRPLAPPRWRDRNPPVRLTVDTEEDYRRARKLYLALEEKALRRFRGEAVLEAAHGR
jgi:spore coat polysaccharide biosynthesis protein SpsF